MIDLFLLNNKIAVFLEQKKENNSNHSKHMKGFSVTRGGNIFSIRPDSNILAEIFCQQQL